MYDTKAKRQGFCQALESHCIKHPGGKKTSDTPTSIHNDSDNNSFSTREAIENVQILESKRVHRDLKYYEKVIQAFPL